MRLLVITAHPHYAGSYLAGTLINHARRGDDIFVVSLTAGELMTDRVSSKELAKINKADAEKAGKLIGIKETRILDIPDATVRADDDTLMKINNLIRELKPNTIITHCPDETHPDFKQTHSAVLDASFYALLTQGKWTAKYPSHWTDRMYSFEYPGQTRGFQPDTFIDISDVVEEKKKTMHCFQVHIDANYGSNDEKYDSAILGPNRHWGIECGAQYAEPFQQIKIHEVHTKAVKHLL